MCGHLLKRTGLSHSSSRAENWRQHINNSSTPVYGSTRAGVVTPRPRVTSTSMSYDCACAMMIGLLARNGDVLCVPKLVRVGPRTSAVNKTLPAAAACSNRASRRRRQVLCIDGTGRQTDGRMDGRTDTRPLHGPCTACYAGGVRKENIKLMAATPSI